MTYVIAEPCVDVKDKSCIEECLPGGDGRPRLALARLFRLDVPSSRALIFTGATRNSLVVLPLALALPDAYAITAVIVVTQTLVELVGMVIYVRAVPRLVPQHPQSTQ
jgi:ACR3 family arsenite efflux pump ArsB